MLTLYSEIAGVYCLDCGPHRGSYKFVLITTTSSPSVLRIGHRAVILGS